MNATVLLDPSTTDRLSFMPLVASFSAAEGTRKDTGIVTRLKWPNEVLIGEKTVGRTSWNAFRCGTSTRLAVTMTVNCNFHSSLLGEPESTSILDELGVKIDIAMLLSKTLESLNWMYSEWERGLESNLVFRISPTIEHPGEGGCEARLRTGIALHLPRGEDRRLWFPGRGERRRRGAGACPRPGRAAAAPLTSMVLFMRRILPSRLVLLRSGGDQYWSRKLKEYTSKRKRTGRLHKAALKDIEAGIAQWKKVYESWVASSPEIKPDVQTASGIPLKPALHSV